MNLPYYLLRIKRVGMFMNQNDNLVSISQLNNVQLVCSYLFLKKTAKHFYHKKLASLFKKEKEAIVRDLELFEEIKQQEYFLRCSTPQKWLENRLVYKKLLEELKKREISIN